MRCNCPMIITRNGMCGVKLLRRGTTKDKKENRRRTRRRRRRGVETKSEVLWHSRRIYGLFRPGNHKALFRGRKNRQLNGMKIIVIPNFPFVLHLFWGLLHLFLLLLLFTVQLSAVLMLVCGSVLMSFWIRISCPDKPGQVIPSGY